jgi:hypothetical protein
MKTLTVEIGWQWGVSNLSVNRCGPSRTTKDDSVRIGVGHQYVRQRVRLMALLS